MFCTFLTNEVLIIFESNNLKRIGIFVKVYTTPLIDYSCEYLVPKLPNIIMKIRILTEHKRIPQKMFEAFKTGLT